ncbi:MULTISPECIES: cupredoxin family copper-binding protein [unclassified Bradyrhizobium]|uniref:cupredoxin domain-containing protein n=1 Tax=unclassified Bradyrhizobium TaxID=2631580 RepID=UPI0028EF67A7|nr:MULTISPECIES: cupredoxin family copper-binding protein [unclassified Bradyrhizobium]
MLSGRLAFLSVVVLAAVSAPARAATIRITIDKLAFSPAAASAKVGDTVEWVNKDALAHTATARDGALDVTLPPSKTVSSVLKKAGTVDYYCRFHPNMKATLTIAP